MDKKFTFKLIDKETEEMLYYINIYQSSLYSAKQDAVRLVGEVEDPAKYYDSVGFEKKFELKLWQVTKIVSVPFYDYSNGQSKQAGQQMLT